jgi:anti-sigma factor RsiW
MTCDEAKILLHALIDGELDAGHAREVEAHIAGCASCAAEASDYRKMREVITKADLRYTAPASLRQRIDAALPKATPAPVSNVQPLPSRRSLLRGFAMGSAVSALAATLLVAIVVRNDDQQMVEAEIVSAHLRSLQPGHLIDVVSTDQHTVKPWFEGKLDFAPTVIDFAPEGFPLLGGRVDFIAGKRAAALVYGRRKHLINVYEWPAGSGLVDTKPTGELRLGYSMLHWSHAGMVYWAVSDVSPADIQELARNIDNISR